MLEQYNNKNNPFKVPENYFEDFHKTIMEKVGEEETESTVETVKMVPLWKKLAPWVAVAAVFSGVLFGTGILDETVVVKQENSANQSLNMDEYYSFLESELVPSEYEEYIYDEVD